MTARAGIAFLDPTVGRFVSTVALCAALGVQAGCSIDTSKILAGGNEGEAGGARLADRARAAFDAEPRSYDSVTAAFEMMQDAATGATSSDTARYSYLTDAARYAIWLMSRSESALDSLADEAVVFCNTAIATDSSRAAAFYYRAITVGLIARRDMLKGRAAMRNIRDDCRRAIAIDPALDKGGPHRVLGALYLRAPGPPAGIGSLRLALSHLEESARIAPVYAENRLFLAEAYLDDGRGDDARRLLDAVETQLADSSVAVDDLTRWTEWIAELRARQDEAGN